MRQAAPEEEPTGKPLDVRQDGGQYFDLDDKVLLALNNCSEINPKEQETDDENKYAFINAIIDICKKSIEQQP